MLRAYTILKNSARPVKAAERALAKERAAVRSRWHALRHLHHKLQALRQVGSRPCLCWKAHVNHSHCCSRAFAIGPSHKLKGARLASDEQSLHQSPACIEGRAAWACAD